MIKVLDKTKTLTTLVADTSNGLGQLKVMNDLITEELNGIYELEFDILTTENHYQDLKDNMLVKVNVNEMDDEQIFRVYFISEPINFVSHVKCQHITYDLSKIVVKPFTATGAVAIKNGLVTYMLGSYPFSTWTDITNTTSVFKNEIPRPFRECLGGYEGSVLDVLRPEYEWDNLTVKLHAHRGSDHDTRISYGKNLTDFEQEENNENVYDAVYGYAVVDDVTYEATSIYNKTGATYPKVLNVDFSSKYESGDTPTGAELLSYATTYATNNDIEVPSVNIKVSFVPLWQTEEYKNIAPLERVFLGDTVHVFFDKLNVEASSRVIKTVWSPSLKRYTEIELGSAKANLNTVINDTVNQAVENLDIDVEADVGYLEEQLESLSSLIINGLGLYKTEEQVPGGGVRIILHNKPTLLDSDTQYYMSAAGIMVSTDYGTTWTAGFDAQTGELYTQALSTIVLKALEIYGSFMRFGDVDSNYIDVAPYSVNSVPQGVSFDGTGTIRMQPQESFIVNNKAVGSSYNYNKIAMSNNSSDYNQGYIALTNYDDLNGYKTANWLYLYSHYGSSNSNMAGLINYETSTGVSENANSLTMSANSTSKTATMSNRKVGATTYANMYSLSASSAQNQLYMYNYRFTADEVANEITMTSLNGSSTIALRNRNSGSANFANYISLTEVPNGANTVAIYNQDSSGSVKNYISMNSSTAMMSIYSDSDIFLNSGGAVRVSSSSGQDITFTSDDSLKLSGAKIYINGTQIYLSGGYVRY